MSIWRLVLGVLWLTLGLYFIVKREGIRARQAPRLGRLGQSPMLYLVLGGIYALLGALWITDAFT